MIELIKLHEEYEDHMFLSYDPDTKTTRFFVVSNHLQDKSKTEVAEIWLDEYNIEELRDSLNVVLSELQGDSPSKPPATE